MTWTPETCDRLLALRAAGATFGKIAAALGVTRNQAISKHARLVGRNYDANRNRCKVITAEDHWEKVLFEPWVEYRARRVAERAAQRCV